MFHLFRLFNRRALSRVGSLGFPSPEPPPPFLLTKDRKGREGRLGVTLAGVPSRPAPAPRGTPVAGTLSPPGGEEVERPDFLNFGQFAEMLGHVAVGAFAHARTEDRVATLWKWFDQCESKKAILENIRFAIRSGYD